MARYLQSTLDSSPFYDMIWWMWVLLGICTVVPLIVTGMARTKRTSYSSPGDEAEGTSGTPARKKQRVSSGSKKGRKARDAFGDREMAPDRRQAWDRRFDALGKGAMTDDIERWIEGVRQRGITCERQLDDTVMTQSAYTALARKGLADSMRRTMSYDEALVREFYSVMVVERTSLEIVARLGGRLVVVSPHTIAEYMGYTRPPPETVRLGPRPRVTGRSREILGAELIRQGQPAWISGGIGVGQFHAHYQLLAKILGCNVFPRGNFKKLGVREADLLVASYRASEDASVDFAAFIFHEIADFVDGVSAILNLPFPVMITEMARQAGVPIGQLTAGRPGPISQTTTKKARAQAAIHHGPPPPRADFEPDARGAMQRIEQWAKALYQRQTEVLGRQTEMMRVQSEIQAEQQRSRRALRTVEHQVAFMLEFVEEMSQEQCPPLPDSPIEPAEPPAQDPPPPPPQSPVLRGLIDTDTDSGETGESEHDSDHDASAESEAEASASGDGDGDGDGDEQDSRAEDSDYGGDE